MLIQPEYFQDVFFNIRSETNDGSSLVIFVAPDCDSLCALRILTVCFLNYSNKNNYNK